MRSTPYEICYAARRKKLKGRIVRGDATDCLKSRPSDCARVVLLDPPFNLGKKYDNSKKSDRRPEKEYRDWITAVASEAARVLEPGGSLFLYHIPIWAMRVGDSLDEALTFRQWIAVSMKNGFVRANRLYPAHYALLMFTKGSIKRFVRPKIAPQECRICGELVKDYGASQPIIRRNAINLTTISYALI